MAWATALTSGAKAVYKSASDAYAASTFNRNAYNEANKKPVKYRNDDIDCNAAFDPEEEWTAVTAVPRNPLKEPNEVYLIQDHASKFQQLRFKISQKAAEAASEAAGVSLDYTQWALKYVALEAARDVGWISNCKTATDAVRAVQARFPFIEDIQAAYRSGSSAGGRHSSGTGSGGRYRNGSFDASRYGSRTYEPEAGVVHPRDVRVPSNLDDIPIFSDDRIRAHLALHRGQRVWDPEARAEVEYVLEPVIRNRNVLEKGSEAMEAATDERGEFDDVELNSDEDEDDDGERYGRSFESTSLSGRSYASGPIIGSRDSEEMKAEEANRR